MLVNKIGRVMKAVFSNEYGYKFIVLISFWASGIWFMKLLMPENWAPDIRLNGKIFPNKRKEVPLLHKNTSLWKLDFEKWIVIVMDSGLLKVLCDCQCCFCCVRKFWIAWKIWEYLSD